MVALWTILVGFCLIIFTQLLKAHGPLKVKSKVLIRLKKMFQAVFAFLWFFPIGAMFLLTAPIWILVWLISGWNVQDFYMRVSDKSMREGW